jgi:hypothetical protein
VLPGLSFCKNCGARVGGKKERDGNQLSESSVNFLIAALLGIPIAGIGVIIGLISVMKKELDMPNDVIVIITFLSFSLLLMAEVAFLWLLLSRTKKKKEKEDPYQLNEPLNKAATKSLGEAQPQSFVNQASSVTENTTRTLEMAERESK